MKCLEKGCPNRLEMDDPGFCKDCMRRGEELNRLRKKKEAEND